MTPEKKLAFNAPNLEGLVQLIKINKELKNQFIIQVSAKLFYVYGLENINAIIQNYKSSMWFSVDHCKDITQLSKFKKDDGWSSVLFDASEKSLKENIELSKSAAFISRTNGFLLESEVNPCELNTVSRLQDIKKFIKIVHCDFVGVSIGTEHGKKVGSKVNLNVIDEIYSTIKTPIVIHGGSGLDDITLNEVFKKGVFKVNISTALKEIYLETVNEREKYDSVKVNSILYERFLNFISNKLEVIKN